MISARGIRGEGRAKLGPAVTTTLIAGNAGQPAATSKFTRVTRVALVVNAVAHGSGTIGMAIGLGPHAAEQPNMGRRAAAAGVAGVFMMGYVAKRLPESASLIALPIVFVLCNLIDSIYEFVASGDPHHLAPAVVEGTFLAIYSAYAFAWRRPSTA